MYLALRKKIEEKELNKIMEKLIKEGSDYMLAVEEMVIEENKRLRAEGRVEGRAEGNIEGRLQARKEIIKQMIKNKMSEEEIIKYTKIGKKELEKLKAKMRNLKKKN